MNQCGRASDEESQDEQDAGADAFGQNGQRDVMQAAKALGNDAAEREGKYPEANGHAGGAEPWCIKKGGQDSSGRSAGQEPESC